LLGGWPLMRASMESAQRGRALLAWGVLGVVGGLLAVHLTADPDFPWHVKTGELIVARRSTLPVDVFSFSYAGAPWAYKDVAADVVLYLGWAAFGVAAMPVFHFIVTLLYPVALRPALAPSDRDPILLASVAICTVSGYGLAERPQLFAHVLFLALLALFDRAHRLLAEDDSRRSLVGALAPVVLVEYAWIWTHRSAAIGLALGLVFPLRLVAARAARSSGRLRALFGAPVSMRAIASASGSGVLAAALVVANPTGLALIRTAAAQVRSKMLRQLISEYYPIGLWGFFRAWPVGATLSVVALVSGAACLMARVRWTRSGTDRLLLWHVTLLGGFVALLWDSARWLQFATLSAGLVLLHVVGECAEVVRERWRAPRGAGVLVMLLALGVGVAGRASLGPFEIGYNPRFYPIGALAFAREHGLVGNVVAPLHFGGYILERAWPAVRVLVDGRSDQVYPPEFVVKTAVANTDAKAFAKMRRHDGASWVIASNESARVTHRFLASDPAWMMVYWSEYAVVYVSRAAHPELAPLAFELLRDPDALPDEVHDVLAAGGDPAGLHGELLRMVHESPASVRAGVALCRLYHLSGPSAWSMRDAVLRNLAAIAPAHPLVKAMQDEVRAGAP